MSTASNLELESSQLPARSSHGQWCVVAPNCFNRRMDPLIIEPPDGACGHISAGLCRHERRKQGHNLILFW